jgi:hypothetical protein
MSRHVLVALAATAALHLWTAAAGVPRLPFHLAVALGWGGWLAWQIARRPAVVREWGFRADNLRAAAGPAAALVSVAGAAMVAWGLATEAAFPLHALIPLAVYPLWGLAQQFFLQAVVVRALRDGGAPAPAAVGVAAGLFAFAHLPYGLPLVALSGALAVATSALYLRTPNLWVLAAVHGWLGTLAFYAVLHRDAWEVVLRGV